MEGDRFSKAERAPPRPDSSARGSPRKSSPQPLDRGPAIIGQSPALRAALRLISRVAATSASVLVCGETGTGKELLARGLHSESGRTGRFVPVNCAAVPRSLLESELFGHERGAFTGAVQRRRGVFELASGGTIFLDEIGDMGLGVQAEILRVLEEQVVRRVGGERTIPVDVRIVAATNRDLEADVERGRVREDLYHRIAVVVIRLPPLRERGDDLRLLAEHFLTHFSCQYGQPAPILAEESLELLRSYPWPGNVRELRNAMERAIVLVDGDSILPEHLPPAIQHPSASSVPRNGTSDAGGSESGASTGLGDETFLTLDELEREHIQRVLAATGGHYGRAAEILGVHRNTLRRRMKRFGLD